METTIADAERTRQDVLAAAEKTRSYARADNDWQRTTDRVDAKNTFWIEPIQAELTRRYEIHQAAFDMREANADANRTRSDGAADASYDYALARTDAYSVYHHAQIDARGIDTGADPNIYYAGVRWLFDWQASVNNSADLSLALAQAWHTYATASIDLSETYQLELISIDAQFEGDVQSAGEAAADTTDDPRRDYLESTVRIDRDHAVQAVADASARDAELTGLKVQYITDVGAAQVARAEASGDARIALAAARGDAGINLATALASVESAYTTALASAENARASSSSSAQSLYAAALASAGQWKVAATGIVDVGYRTAEGSAAVTRAESLAEAAADYHFAVATADAAAAASLASGVPTADNLFQSAYYSAQAAWIASMKPQYVAHRTLLSQADVNLAVALAVADADRNDLRAAAQAGYQTNMALLEAAPSRPSTPRSPRPLPVTW